MHFFHAMKRRRLLIAGLFFIALAIAAGAIFLFHASRTRPNLIIVSIDTLRADRLGSYGYARDTSPVIDDFGKRSVVFENTVSPSSWTIPSHMTLFTGLHPTTHGAVRPELKVSRNIPLLAEILKAQGYRTIAYTGGGFVGKGFGFSRGFEKFKAVENFKKKKRGIGCSIGKAEKTLSALPPGDPYFLFLHTYDVHCPLHPPEPYASMYKSPGALPVGSIACGREMIGAIPRFSAAHALSISDRYDGSIRWVDNELRKLFDMLKARGDLEKSVIIITSDHGEEFFEHGIVGHQRTLHRQVLMVPFILYAPGIKPARVSRFIGQVDIFPTILDLLNLPVPNESQGVSLLPLMRGKDNEPPRKFQYSELDRDIRLRSLMSKDSHLIYDLDSNNSIFFDSMNDSTEQSPLTGDPRMPEQLEGLDAIIAGIPPARGRETASPTQNDIEKLKTLGYF